MSNPSASVCEDLDLLEDFTIPCSGTGHRDTPSLHGDPSLPAEFYIKNFCNSCDKEFVRPVCRFFAENLRANETRTVACSLCGRVDFATDVFTVIGKI